MLTCIDVIVAGEAFVPDGLPIPMLHWLHFAGTGLTPTQLLKTLKS
jgi:hypothetical protein